MHDTPAYEAETEGVLVRVRPSYLAGQSDPDGGSRRSHSCRSLDRIATGARNNVHAPETALKQRAVARRAIAPFF